jgi:hypothetical protein
MTSDHAFQVTVDSELGAFTHSSRVPPFPSVTVIHRYGQELVGGGVGVVGSGDSNEDGGRAPKLAVAGAV